MAKEQFVIEGEAKYCSLDKTDYYDGKDTGRYTLTMLLDDNPEAVEKLESQGVKIREYKNQKVRKFATTYGDFPIVDEEGNPTDRDVPWGSIVRVQYSLGNDHPVHGVSTYMNKVKVLKRGEAMIEDDF